LPRTPTAPAAGERTMACSRARRRTTNLPPSSSPPPLPSRRAPSSEHLRPGVPGTPGRAPSSALLRPGVAGGVLPGDERGRQAVAGPRARRIGGDVLRLARVRCQGVQLVAAERSQVADELVLAVGGHA